MDKRELIEVISLQDLEQRIEFGCCGGGGGGGGDPGPGPGCHEATTCDPE